MGHERDSVPRTAFLPARDMFFAQNGTSKKGTNTKMSRAASQPAGARQLKDSFSHSGGHSCDMSVEVSQVGARIAK